MVNALIITRGGEGSHIYTAGQRHEIPAVPIKRFVDPTGCGNTYRAGLLYALTYGLDWITIGRISTLLRAIKINNAGTQNHSFTIRDFRTQYRREFGTDF